MKNKFSPFIYKNYERIINEGFTVYSTGNQMFQKYGEFEVLITDLSVETPIIKLVDIVNIFVWIKDGLTDNVVFEKYYKGFFFLPGFDKVCNEIRKVIEELDKVKNK